VLALQDTTSFNFHHHPATSGLGPLNGQVNGFLMHSVLLATPEGVPLGLLDQTVWARDPEGPRTADLYQKRPFADKESHRWVAALQAVQQRLAPATRVLCLAMRKIDPHFLRQSGYDASSGLPPPLRTAVRWVAKLGGFLGRKGDGEPGIKVL